MPVGREPERTESERPKSTREQRASKRDSILQVARGREQVRLPARGWETTEIEHERAKSERECACLRAREREREQRAREGGRRLQVGMSVGAIVRLLAAGRRW